MHPTDIDPQVLANVMRWRGRRHLFDDLDPRRTAHIVTDMQNAYTGVGRAMEVPVSREIIPNINAISAAVREAGGLNLFTQMVVDDESVANWSTWLTYFCDAERREASIRDLARGSEGFALDPAIEVLPGDIALEKSRYSPFVPGTSDLPEVLAERGIDTIIISGTVTNCCCETTARDAMQRDFKVVFMADSTAALSDAEHVSTLNNMASIFADVMTTDEVLGIVAANRS